MTDAPSPETTLVILLGASTWPYVPSFTPSDAFANSLKDFREYLLNPSLFALPLQNLLDLFDTNQSSDDIDKEIGFFLEKRVTEMREQGYTASDVLVYFVGHGGFTDGDSHYFLAIRRTRIDNPSASSILIESLARTLKEKARHLRRILILDCCFSASASRFFQAEPTQVAIAQTIDAFKVLDKGYGFPTKGTSLLCSSRHNTPSLIAPDETYTLFSAALLQAVHTRYSSQQDALSLRTIASLTEHILFDVSAEKAPRPEIHSPDQSEGDVADVPFFPNPNEQAIKLYRQRISILRKKRAYKHFSRRTVLKGALATTAGIGIVGGGVWWVKSMLLPHPIYIYRGHTDRVSTVAWSPDGQYIASGSNDKTVHIWNAYTYELVFKYHGPFLYIDSVAWSPDSQRIAVGGWGEAVQAWDVQDGNHLLTFKKVASASQSVAWSSEGTRIASGGFDEAVYLWDAKDGGNLFIYTGQKDEIFSVSWSPDGRQIASGSRDKTVWVWDTVENASFISHLYTYNLHTDAVSAVAWSHDGANIASGSWDTTVQVWDAGKGSHKYTYRGHNDSVYGVAWSHDDSLIASCSYDSTVQVFNAADGKHLFTYYGHTGPVYALAWSLDGQYIASAGKDKTVQIWRAIG